MVLSGRAKRKEDGAKETQLSAVSHHQITPHYRGQAYDYSLKPTNNRKTGHSSFSGLIQLRLANKHLLPTAPSPARLHLKLVSIANNLFPLKEKSSAISPFWLSN